MASAFFILPNTAARYTAEDAIRTARLASEVLLSNRMKLDALGDEPARYFAELPTVAATTLRIMPSLLLRM
jgi:thiazole synthase